MLTTPDLLAGPRGRRVLLAFAVASEHARLREGEASALVQSVFDVSSNVPVVETGTVMFILAATPFLNSLKVAGVPVNVPDSRRRRKFAATPA